MPMSQTSQTLAQFYISKRQIGKQMRSKKSVSAIGKGKVTPVQVAFIIDRYDNKFVRTRSAFRSEASHLIAKSPVNEAPKSLLTLGDMSKAKREFKMELGKHGIQINFVSSYLIPGQIGERFGFHKQSTGLVGQKSMNKGKLSCFLMLLALMKQKKNLRKL
ncbi:hypothetical protein L2E82_16271 [Cichorium intybus]|uniref:Uncharacterized protein n=1 Tax=Cichorium intybus TaxID=13427 RepID=A0ACB9F547_CICIN|nr:hypothetical protein L2E82_16271 [Cichorium intybus]